MAFDPEVLVLCALPYLGIFRQYAGSKGSRFEAAISTLAELRGLFAASWLEMFAASLVHLKERNVRGDRLAIIAGLAEEMSASPGNVNASSYLVPILSRVRLHGPIPPTSASFSLSALNLEGGEVELFPHEVIQYSKQDYLHLWNRFKDDVIRIGCLNSPLKFATFLSIVKKYTWRIPFPEEDIRESKNSLFDHLKLALAVASCLNTRNDLELGSRFENEHEPAARILRGDLSGIQDFIYRIVQPDSESKGTAKRLRGRSFYLTVVLDVVTDWICRSFDLTNANILFCSGGGFDLLIPQNDSTEEKEKNLDLQLQHWFIEKFWGELSLTLTSKEVFAEDFRNFGKLHCDLNSRLSEKKKQKFHSVLDTMEFFVPSKRGKLCRVCRINPIVDDSVCDDCERHGRVGGELPSSKSDFLAFIYSPTENVLTNEDASFEFGDPFDVRVLLCTDRRTKELVKAAERLDCEIRFHRINSSEIGNDFPMTSENIALLFKPLANEAPTANGNIFYPGEETIHKGEILDFGEIARLSTGAPLLGVLKMDVDYLGVILAKGLEPITLPQYLNLSDSLELFFTFGINEACRSVTEHWKASLPDNDRRLLTAQNVDDIFYVVYSGGDDLLILGPWDQLLELSDEIRRKFSRYCCANENVTISGGYLLVKPRFPIHRFADLVNIELEKSKSFHSPDERYKKNRISLFGNTVSWVEDEQSLSALLEFGRRLADQIEDKENPLPRSFLYFLDSLHNQCFLDEETYSPLWVPRFFYMLSRRLQKEVVMKLRLTELVPRLIKRIHIPVVYASLRTRKE